MRQRRKSHLDIYSQTNELLLRAPITEGARRSFSLMEKDEILLSFYSDKAVILPIGTYLNDELFGTFMILEEYAPSYDSSKGCYTYSVVFERPYMMFRNVLHKFGNEVQWTLTDSLETHANALKYYGTYAFGVSIHKDDIPEAGYAKTLSFDGTSLLDAIKKIAEAWNCEWWFTGEFMKDLTLHFGKMLTNDAPLRLSYERNLANLTAEKSEAPYANRIYPLGGDRNIPPSYRGKLLFTCTKYDGGFFEDENRPLSKDMIHLPEDKTLINIKSSSQMGNQQKGVLFEKKVHLYNGTYRCNPYVIKSSIKEPKNALPYQIKIELFTSAGESVLLIGSSVIGGFRGYDNEQVWKYSEVRIDKTADYFIRVSYQALQGQINSENLPSYGEMNMSADIEMVSYLSGAQLSVTKSDGSEVICECQLSSHYNDDSARFLLRRVGGADLSVGEIYTVQESFLNDAYIPFSWYSPDNGKDNYGRIGSRRLLLPKGMEFVGDKGLNPFAVVEEAVLFDNVYPRIGLIAESVGVDTQAYDEIENADGSKTKAFYPRYTIANNTLSFKNDYILSDVELEALFLTKEEAKELGIEVPANQPCRLAGMSFGVKFNPEGYPETDSRSQAFRLARNENYGTKLPNLILKPEEGDPFVLRGWNVRAIGALGLIEKAELELQKKAEEYLSAMTEMTKTYTATLVSARLFDNMMLDMYQIPVAGQKVIFEMLESHIPFNATDGVFVDSGDRTFLVKSGRVESRIIGYEMKMDKPYDAPVLTIGDGQVYSRLKRIEKEISKLKN